MSEEVNGRYWVRKRVIWMEKKNLLLCLWDELGGGDAIKDVNVSIFEIDGCWTLKFILVFEEGKKLLNGNLFSGFIHEFM